MSNSLVVLRDVALFQTGVYQAVVNVDVDVDAERVVILDRRSVISLGNQKVFNSNMMLRVPIEYATSNNLVVGIIDDNNIFAGKFIDGVNAELIDPKVTTIR